MGQMNKMESRRKGIDKRKRMNIFFFSTPFPMHNDSLFPFNVQTDDDDKDGKLVESEFEKLQETEKKKQKKRRRKRKESKRYSSEHSQDNNVFLHNLTQYNLQMMVTFPSPPYAHHHHFT